MGDRASHLRTALGSLPDVVAVSSVYETSPMGGPPGQGPYLNAVVELSTDRSPRELLETGKALEKEAGRVDTGRFGPRPLDVDVLIVGDLVVQEEDLVVPHPRMMERRFVLVPLYELAPELVSTDEVASAGGEVRQLGRLLDEVI
jgi:2-amino-4-hydroxy-6-hydroxymethyldihydropteridine diphosphokinase